MSAFIAALLSIAGITGAPPPDIPDAAPTPEMARPLDNQVIEVPPDARKASGPLKCQIEVDGGPGHRSIVALATAAQAPESGTFTLEIEKMGPNTTRSRQHGDFVLATGETKRLAKVRMSVGANETLSGRLLLSAKHGDTVCEIK